MKLCLICGKSFSREDWQCPSCGVKPERTGGFLSFAPSFSEGNDLYPSDGFARLAPLEEESFWFRARNELIVWALRKWLPVKGKFLEIGCGTGFVLSRIEREFPGLEISGSEIYVKGLAYAAQRLKHAELFQMDACDIPFVEEFNVVGLFDTLEHIPADEKVLSQIHRALAPGGGILITVPQHAFLWSYVDEFTRHVRRYEKSDLVLKLQKAGFKLVAATSFVSLLLPMMWLSRIMRRKQKPDFDPGAEFKIRPFLNWILEKILMVERFLIRVGFRFPMGGSLLLVGRKV
jgi:SAM-dependent methyltransferase